MTPLADAIRTLYAYAAWATARVLDAADGLPPERLRAATPSGSGPIHDTLVHTMDAQRTWLARCREEAPDPTPDPAAFPDVAAVRAAWVTLDRDTAADVAGLTDDDLARVVSSRSASGERWSHPRWQMLLHQANHATQHRSEVAAALTALGRSPGGLDLIVFLRERDIGASAP